MICANEFHVLASFVNDSMYLKMAPGRFASYHPTILSSYGPMGVHGSWQMATPCPQDLRFFGFSTIIRNKFDFVMTHPIIMCLNTLSYCLVLLPCLTTAPEKKGPFNAHRFLSRFLINPPMISYGFPINP